MTSAIGFIGLGAMGRPMVNSLLAAGHRVAVFDVRPEAVARLVEDGAVGAASAREVAAGSDLVVTMLPRAEDVSAAIIGPDGVAAGIRRGSTVLDASTIDVGSVRALEAPIAARGAAMLDGGVSGSPTQAWERKVTLMVGGDPDVVEGHRAVLEAMASTVVYTGPLGTAKVMKLANNMVAAITTAALAEAYTLITRSGGDPLVAKSAMERSWANSTLLAIRPPLPGMTEGSPASNGYRAEFSIDYMAKDLAAVLESARQAGVTLSTAALVRQLFEAAGERGDGHLDVSALIRTVAALGPAE